MSLEHIINRGTIDFPNDFWEALRIIQQQFDAKTKQVGELQLEIINLHKRVSELEAQMMKSEKHSHHFVMVGPDIAPMETPEFPIEIRKNTAISITPRRGQ